MRVRLTSLCNLNRSACARKECRLCSHYCCHAVYTRLREGEWEGTVMVIGEDGECEGAGLCTGMFIHPEVVMTAGHCCETGATKAICSGKVRCVG